MKKFGIMSKLVSLFCLGLIISSLIISLITYNTSKNILGTNVQLTSSQTLQESTNGLTIYLKSLSQQVDLLSRKNELKRLESPEIVTQNLNSTYESLIAALKTAPGAVSCYYATINHRFISVTPFEQNGKTKYKQRLKENMDLSTQGWYSEALKNIERDGVYAAYTEPYFSKSANTSVITISQCVKSNEEVVGVVAIDIAFSALTDFIHNIKLLNTGSVFLSNDEGTILVSPSNENVSFTSFAELPMWDRLNTSEPVSFNDQFGKNLHYITAFTDPITNWRLIGIVSDVELKNSLSKLFVYTLIAILTALLISIILFLLILKSMKGKFIMLGRTIHEIANGNFVKQPIIPGVDEFHLLSEEISEMTQNISSLIKDVADTSEVLFETTHHIATITDQTQDTTSNVKIAIEEISIGTTHQAESLQEINVQVDTLGNKLEDTKNHTSSVKEMSTKTQALSTTGLAMLKELGDKSNHSNEISSASYAFFKEMTESINKINFISDTIIQITNQTNMLSLNASIEAARAGESGKGFAVVADEIRKLSEASKHSTDEIKTIVDEIHAKSEQASASLEESQIILHEQSEAITSTADVFKNILSSIDQLVKNIYEIDALNTHMIESKNLVIHNMDEMAAVSEQTASSSEEVNASTEEVASSMERLTSQTKDLTQAAERLKENLKRFKL